MVLTMQGKRLFVFHDFKYLLYINMEKLTKRNYMICSSKHTYHDKGLRRVWFLIYVLDGGELCIMKLDELSIFIACIAISHLRLLRVIMHLIMLTEIDNYSGVIMSAMVSQITGVSIVYSTVVQAQIKEISKVRVTGLCEGKSPMTGEFLAQRTSNEGKCFHLMTSSCPILAHYPIQRYLRCRILCMISHLL